jgi:predicted nucleic acid-binding protein
MAGQRNNNNWQEKIFLDTSALIAVYSDKDKNWREASAILQKLLVSKVELVLTDYILGETYTGLLGKAGYDISMKFDRDLKKKIWSLVWVTRRRFAAAQEVFCKFNKDKLWSFIDCTSYVAMKEQKIRKVFTFDHDFEQMGFEML